MRSISAKYAWSVTVRWSLENTRVKTASEVPSSSARTSNPALDSVSTFPKPLLSSDVTRGATGRAARRSTAQKTMMGQRNLTVSLPNL